MKASCTTALASSCLLAPLLQLSRPPAGFDVADLQLSALALSLSRTHNTLSLRGGEVRIDGDQLVANTYTVSIAALLERASDKRGNRGQPRHSRLPRGFLTEEDLSLPGTSADVMHSSGVS